MPAEAFVVGHLGRLAPEKNLEFLARAVALFFKKCKSARFLVVGDGPSAARLRAFFEQEKLAERLVMPGQKTGKELHDAYAAMDVFAFSSFTETQGMVLAEAMAAGLPAVALDASGVREVVRDGENGFLLDARASAAAFGAGLQRIERDARLRRRLSAEAKRTACGFSEDASARKAINLYKRVLRQTRCQRAQTDQEAFGTVLKRIEVEWGLLAGKAEAAFEAVTANGRSPKVS